jgi:hypothetical protein
VPEHGELLEELRARLQGRITLVVSARDEINDDAVALRGLILNGLVDREAVKVQRK